MFSFKLKYKTFSDLYMSPKTDVCESVSSLEFCYLSDLSIFKFLTLSYSLRKGLGHVQRLLLLLVAELGHTRKFVFSFFFRNEQSKKNISRHTSFRNILSEYFSRRNTSISLTCSAPWTNLLRSVI